MGLFDKLKNAAENAAASAAGAKIAEKLEEQIGAAKKFAEDNGISVNNTNNAESSNSYSYAPQPAAQTYEPEEESDYPQMGVATDQFAKFDRVISENFAGYEVKRNAPASELKPGCHPSCKPISFLFYKDGSPVLAVVLVRTNTYRGMNVVATKNICDELGIRYIRFYEEYNTEESYIINRIKDNL